MSLCAKSWATFLWPISSEVSSIAHEYARASTTEKRWCGQSLMAHLGEPSRIELAHVSQSAVCYHTEPKLDDGFGGDVMPGEPGLQVH